MAKRSPGYSLVEILVAVGVVSAGAVTWASFQGYIGRSASQTMVAIATVSELRSASGMVEGISKQAVIRAAKLNLTGESGCLPHPYSVSVAGNCRNARKANFDASTSTGASALASWKALSDAIIAWPGASSGSTGGIPEALDAGYFTSKISPALQQAGCLHCHGPLQGSTRNYSVATLPWASDTDLNLTASLFREKPAIALRDFSRFDDVVRPFGYQATGGTRETAPPLATLAILSSPLGESILQREVQLYSGSASGTLVKTRVYFDIEEFSTSVQLKRSIFRTREGYECACPPPASKFDRDSSLTCRTLITTEPPEGANPTAYACQREEEYKAGTCQETCIKQSSPPICGCGKGCSMICPGWTPKCIKYQVRYSCESNSEQTTGGPIFKPAEAIAYDRNGNEEKKIISQDLLLAEDRRCLSMDNACQSRLCGSVGAGDTGSCILENSCKVRCTDPIITGGYSCGKGCYVPARQSACRSVDYTYTCVTPNQSLEVSSILARYTLSTTRQERDQNGQLKTKDTHTLQGVIE